MKIAVIGPGAMGLLFGSYLSQHHDVTLVGTNPAKMQSITENGVTIREMDGSERIYRPHATADTTLSTWSSCRSRPASPRPR